MAALAFVVLSSLPLLQARAEGSLRLVVGPVRLLFEAGVAEDKPLSIFLAGGTPGTVDVRIYDAVVDPVGGWKEVEFGSTAATLDGFVELSPTEFDYTPDGSEQTFTTLVRMRAVPDREPRYGVIIATLRPSVEAGAGEAGVAAAAAVQVLVAPPDATMEPESLSLSVDRLDVSAGPWTPIDAILPDLPGVVGRGPASFTAQGTNTGSGALNEVTVFEVRRISPLSLFSSDAEPLPPPLIRISLAPKLLLPGQRFLGSANSLIPVEGQVSVDSLPFIGFVRITARATGSVGGVEAQEGVRSRTILVAPWSEGLVLAGVWVLYRGRRQRGHVDRAPRRRVMGIGEARRGRRLTDRFRRQNRGGPDQPTLF